MKATEQLFPVVLFVMLYRVVLFFSRWMKPQIVTIHMKAAGQCIPVAQFIVLHKVVLNF